LDVNKFPLIVSRIIGKLGDQSKQIFNENESLQLQQLFGLTSESLSLLLDGVCYILEMAAYHNVNPLNLVNQLVQAKLNKNKADAFGSVWQQHAAAFIGKLTNQTPTARHVLEGVSWRLHMTMSQTAINKSKTFNAIMNFQLSDTDPGAKLTGSAAGGSSGIGARSDDASVVVEMSPTDLQNLYQKLELLQKQLDSLT